jgi:hypothetical protein
MSSTRLPDGSVVMRPSGQRAVSPVGTGQGKITPVAARGAGSGRGSLTSVNGSSRQPGRAPAPSTKR